jgi:ribonuclease-3
MTVSAQRGSRRGLAALDLARLQEALQVPVDDDLFVRALTHRSYAYENGALPTNERLEFLGDSVLGLVVTETLYRSHPDLPEGQLAKLRASVVNMRALAGVARTLGLGEYLLLGRGELATGGRDKPSILADGLEAVIGAVYLSCGSAGTAQFVNRLFGPLMLEAAQRGASLDWKTSLQELAAARELGAPEYTVSEAGPDHAKRFAAEVSLKGERYGRGEGSSKKEAEQRAAQVTFTVLVSRGESGGTGDTAVTLPPRSDFPAARPTGDDPLMGAAGPAGAGTVDTSTTSGS